MRCVALVLALTLWPAVAWAGLTDQQIREVALVPPPGARVPNALVFKNLEGRDLTLGDAIAGRSTLLLPANFTCSEICGPALSIAASALSQTGLRAGQDYSLVVVGIDAHDGLDAARSFTTGQIGGPGVSVLTGSAAAISSLMQAIGYHFQPDGANDAIAQHLLRPQYRRREIRLINGVGKRSRLDGQACRLAIKAIPSTRVAAGRLALLCYGFDSVHGIYTRQIVTLLRIGGGLTVAMLAGALGFMFWRSGKRGASA